MPGGPQSRARSQTLGPRPVALLSTSTVCLRWGAAVASLRNTFSIGMTFSVEKDMGVVTMSEVKLSHRVTPRNGIQPEASKS